MKWLDAIRRFLRDEKRYSYLLTLILLVYALLLATRGWEPEPDVAPAIEKIKKAEQILKQSKTERQILEEALKKDFKATLILASFSALFLSALGAGLVIDILFLSRRIRKQPSSGESPIRAPVDWGLSDLAKVIILFFTFGFATSFILGFLRRFFFRHWEENFLILLSTTLNDLTIFFIILYFLKAKYRKNLEDIGIHARAWLRNVGLGLVGYLATLPLFILSLLILLGLASLFSYEPPPHPLVEVFVEEDRRHPLLIGYSIFLACILGPIIEEIFFRGFCYPAFKKVWGMKLAMVVTAAFFAFIHHSTFAFWPIFILGMILTYLYEKRGSLVPSITLHVVHNSLFIGYFFIVKRIFLDPYL